MGSKGPKKKHAHRTGGEGRAVSWSMALIVLIVAIGSAYVLFLHRQELHAEAEHRQELHAAAETPPPPAQHQDPPVDLRALLAANWQGLGGPPCDAAPTTSADAAFERGNALKQGAQYRGAVGCFLRALELQADHPGAYNNMGTTLKRAGAAVLCDGEACGAQQTLAASAHCLRTVIGLNPRHANAYTNLASTLRTQDRLSESIAFNRRATAIAPNHAMAYENLGRGLQAASAPLDPPTAQQQAASGEARVVVSEHGPRYEALLVESVGAFRGGNAARSSRGASRGAATSLMWLGREAEARATLAEAVRLGHWRDPLQYPGTLYPELQSAPLPPRGRVGCLLDSLERAAEGMVADADALLSRAALDEAAGGWGVAGGVFRPEGEGLHTPQRGFANYDVMATCSSGGGGAHPALCAAYDELQLLTGRQVRLARISRLQPGVTIAPHTGLSNGEWRIHLALRLPSDPRHSARIKVGTHVLQWQVGKALLFDDSYEHSVYWEPRLKAVDLSPQAARLVLIVDVPHPDLQAPCVGEAEVLRRRRRQK